MNKFEFYLKYIFRTVDGNYYNWRFYLPLLGVAFGVISVTLTFAIMQGMEEEVFNKLESINYSATISDDNFIKPQNKDFTYVIEKKAIINSLDEYRVINIRAIEAFDSFKENSIKNFLIESVSSTDTKQVIIGRGLASKLGVSVNDVINLISPTDVNLFTGIPASVKVKISGIFNLQLLNYDDQYIFTNLTVGELLFKSAKKQIYSNLKPEEIKLENPEITNITSWRDRHFDFISAMRLEKLAFSSFGFLIILLSSFSSFSIMCITVVRRVAEIGILRTLGFTPVMIANIYFLQSILIGLVGGLIGAIVSKVLIRLDNSYHLITNLFTSEIMFHFNLSIENQQIFMIFSIGLIIMLIAGIYPSIYASKIPILKSLNYSK